LSPEKRKKNTPVIEIFEKDAFKKIPDEA